VITLLALTGLLLVLCVNVFSPLPVEIGEQETKTFRWSAAWGILDENSTIFSYDFAPRPAEVNIETWDDLPFRPPGWFNLTMKIPFEVYNNWTEIYLHPYFYTATDGGVWYFWALKWRLYNSSHVVLSDDWSHSLLVSADRTATLWRDNIEYHLLRSKNSSLIKPGQWYFQITLTAHNSTLFHAQKYHVYYNLFLEIFQKTSSEKPHYTSPTPFYSTLIAGTTIALTLGLYITKKLLKTSYINMTYFQVKVEQLN